MLICLHRISTWESVSCHDNFQLFFFRVKKIIFISSSLLIFSSDCGCSCCVISTRPRFVRFRVWVWEKSRFSNLRYSHSQRASVVAFHERWFKFFHVFYSFWKLRLIFHSNNLHTHCICTWHWTSSARNFICQLTLSATKTEEKKMCMNSLTKPMRQLPLHTDDDNLHFCIGYRLIRSNQRVRKTSSHTKHSQLLAALCLASFIHPAWLLRDSKFFYIFSLVQFFQLIKCKRRTNKSHKHGCD